MSPVAKRPRRPQDAQIWRWLKVHAEPMAGEPITRSYCAPFSRLVRVVDKFAEQVNELARAMHAPMAPGAAEIIARAGSVYDERVDGSFASHEAEIEHYGEAIAWGLRGEPAAEIEAMRAQVAARKAESDRLHGPKSPEQLEESRQLHTDRAIAGLISVATADTSEGRWKGMLAVAKATPEQRREIVERVARALLGDDAQAGR